MTKSARIRARIDPELKGDAEKGFLALGLASPQAIALFYQQVKWQRGLPFPVRIPKETTRRTFEETDAGEGIVWAKDADDMFKPLGL